MGILYHKNIKHKNVYRSMVLIVVGQMTALSKCLWCGTCDCLKLLYSYSLHNSLSSRSLWIDKHTKCATSSGPVSCNQTLVESLATRPSLLEVLISSFLLWFCFCSMHTTKAESRKAWECSYGAKYSWPSIFTIVSGNSIQGQNTIQIWQRRGWALFQVLTTKECPVKSSS